MNRKRIVRVLFVIAGTIALVLGSIGTLIPVLPTTPFLLLACFCYMRSSEKLFKKLINHKAFGTYIYNYVIFRAITKKTKVLSVILLWSSLTISIILIENLHIRLILLVVGVGVTVHLLLLRTMHPEKEDVRSEPAVQ